MQYVEQKQYREKYILIPNKCNYYMGSYKGTLQCHFKTPFTHKDTCTFQDGHYTTLFWKIPVYLQTLSHFEIFFGDIWKTGKHQKKKKKRKKNSDQNL